MSEYKYLGVTLLTFLPAASNRIDLATKAFWSLQSAITDLPGDVFKKLFDSLVALVLDYGALFWSHHISGTLLERVQQKAYRCILGTGRKHPLAAAAGDMCWMPTACRHRIQCILFWITIMKKEETRMSKRVFLIAKEYAEVKRIKNWVQQVKAILASCNLMCWWDKNASTDLTIQECKEVLSSIFYRMEKVQWEKEVLSKAKLRTYHLFKREFITEQYTSTMLCRAHRSLLAKLRGGSVPLEIERGRYIGMATS